jgi:signal transduction histidine kinase/CheY-like chemotaxis protein
MPARVIAVLSDPAFSKHCQHQSAGVRGMSFLQRLIDLYKSDSLAPHGICLLWEPTLIWLHVVSDSLVAIAYFSIPIALAVFVSKRPDVEFGWVFWAFAIFILACGTTHVFGIWTLWYPDYVAQGAIKGFTALASVGTAIGLWPLLPKALALPSPEQLRKSNEALTSQIEQRDIALRALESEKAERIKAEESLRALEQHRQIERLVAVTPDAVIVIDSSGRVRFVNDTAVRLFGKSVESFVGSSFGFSIRPGEVTQIDIPRNGARRIGEMRVADCEWGDAAAYLVVIRDVTEDIATEQQVRQSQKMDAIGQLTGGIAHDFNNLLTVITASIEILGDAVADEPQIAPLAKLIDDAAERGAVLTGQLLAFSRKQPLQPRDINMNTLLANAVQLLRPALGEEFEIEAVPDEETWPAFADPNQLTTALLNLALNARDAMPQGGKITIETANLVLDTDFVKASQGVTPGPYVMIAVSDTGTGMPADIRERVFEPFFTTKAEGKGTGLGLSMVYGFVKQSGGHVRIFSEEGHGTIVRLYLPRSTGQDDLSTELAPALLVEGGSETILVVEDDGLVRSSVVAQLQSLGYTTLTAVDATQALRLIRDGAEFDLLLTDVIMPGGMNGRELADETLKLRRDAKVLFTSGYSEDAIVHNGRLDPEVLLLAKPYRKADLARMVRRALNFVSGYSRSATIENRK